MDPAKVRATREEKAGSKKSSAGLLAKAGIVEAKVRGNKSSEHGSGRIRKFDGTGEEVEKRRRNQGVKEPSAPAESAGSSGCDPGDASGTRHRTSRVKRFGSEADGGEWKNADKGKRTRQSYRVSDLRE